MGNGISESEQQTACIDITVFEGLSRIMVLYFDYPVLHKKWIQLFKIVLVARIAPSSLAF